MKKILLLLLLQLGLTSIHAQNYKFGKVSKEELLEKFNPADSSANATVLYRKHYVDFDYIEGKGFVQQNEIHERVKIYSKEGVDQATKVIRLYDESNDHKERMVGLKAVTHNLNSNKVVQSKLKKSGIFEEKTNDYWKKVKFTLPNIKVGSVIEYKYTIETELLDINDIYFQQMIPIKKIDFRLTIPEYFNYKRHVNIKSAYILNFNNEVKPESMVLSGMNNSPLSLRNRPKVGESRSELKYNQNWTTLVAENIPALKDEAYVSSIGKYAAFLKLELQQLKFPGRPVKSFSTTWDRVTKSIYTYASFGEELNKKNYYKKDLDLILSASDAPDQKVRKIFNYIKSKVKYNNIRGYGTDKGVRKAYKEGIGNVGDINLMLTSMLRYAGLKANPVLLSTVDNGVPLFPTRKGFNYVVSCVEMKEKNILLDATNNYSCKNIIDLDALNWQGRLVRKDGSSEWVNLFPKKNSNNITMISATLVNDLTFKGKVRSQKTDYYAYEYRNEYVGIENEPLIKDLSKNIGEIEITNLNVVNEQELNKPIQQSYDFTYEDGSEEIGDEIYISPMLFLTEEDNVFNKENRSYPVDFSFPRINKNIINLTIPDGYKVKSIPESVKMVMSDDVGEYSYLVKQMGNTVQVSEALKINFPIVAVMYYPELREIFKKLIEKNAEKIVLEKI